jgi:hypothetical protein
METRWLATSAEAGKGHHAALFLQTHKFIDIVGKILENIVLSRDLQEVNEGGLLRDEQFKFPSKHTTTLQLARLVERVDKNFEERLLTGAVFLDVAKAFDTIGQRPPLQANRPQLSILPGENSTIIPRLPNFPNVLLLSHVHALCHAGWCGPGWTRIPCALQFVCKPHTHTQPPRRVSAIRGRHASRSHVSQSITSR